MIDFFGEDDFAEQMKNTVVPVLQSRDAEGDFSGAGGAKLHYHSFINPDEKAAVVISHGFGESFPKYHEMIYYYYQSGFSVFFVEHRGHGYSQREIGNLSQIHCTSFQNYVDDFKCFMDSVVSQKSLSKKYLLYSHSMGGCIGALFLEQYPGYFKAAVLSTPMMGLTFGGANPLAIKLMMAWSKLAHWDEKYLPTQHDFDGTSNFNESSGQSKARHDYLFEFRLHNDHYQTNGGTYKWARESFKAMDEVIANAGKIDIPVILFQAGQDSLVTPGGQDAFLAHNPAIKKMIYPDSKHEIFNSSDSDRMEYFTTIIGFYEKYDG